MPDQRHPRVPGVLAHRRFDSPRFHSAEWSSLMPTAARVFCGAVCEILGDYVDREVRAARDSANPYATGEDFEQALNLTLGVDRLRSRESCSSFATAAAELLEPQSAIHADCAAALRRVCEEGDHVVKAVRDAVRDALEGLRVEAALLVHHQQRQGEGHSALEDLLRQHGIPLASAAVDQDALESFRPAERSVQERLQRVREKVDSIVSTAEAVAARCLPAVAKAKRKIVERGIVRMRGDAEPAGALDSTILALGGRVVASLGRGNTSLPGGFDCDGSLALLLSCIPVVGDSHAAKHLSAVSEASSRFLRSLGEVAEDIVRTERLPECIRSALVTATATVDRMAAMFDIEGIAVAADAFQAERQKANHAVSLALKLAQCGEISLARRVGRLFRRADGSKPTAESVKAAIDEQMTTMKLLRMSFKDLSEEVERLTTIWQSVVAYVQGASAKHDHLRSLLAIFHNHHAKVSWAPGSECAGALAEMLRKAEAASAIAGVAPVVPAWLRLHEAIQAATPRDIPAAVAFVNAMCAMASVDGSLGRQECDLIRAGAEKMAALPLAACDLEATVGAWRDLRRGEPMLDAVAQAIVDAAAIHDQALLERLLGDVRLVAKVDGGLEGEEICVYRALFSAIMRRAHA